MARISLSKCVLLHADGFSGSFFHRNATTAWDCTTRGTSIGVSLSCPERPLLPTILFVECNSVDFTIEAPRIVRAVEDVILFSVLIDPRRHPGVSPCDYDFFVYRVVEVPTLQRLPPPHPDFLEDIAGLLRCGDDDDDGFIVTSLSATCKSPGTYDLHRFDSRTWAWSHEVVPLVAPQAAFPFQVPINAIRLGYHYNSTVITIGGEMGWVDLWRGILICDVLHPKPKVRGVPLPVPMELLTCNYGRGADIGGCGKYLRGITVVNQTLKFVHLETTVNTSCKTLPPAGSNRYEEPDPPMFDWMITTWSNSKMGTSWDDWTKDCEARASHTTIHSKPKTKMLNSGLLSHEGADQVRGLQNLGVSHPAPGIDGDVVYLLARLRFQDQKAFVIALDARNNVLLGSAEFATEKKHGDGIMYFPSNISKYIPPEARIYPITKGDEDDGWDESSLNEGTEGVEFPDLKSNFVFSYDFGIKDASASALEPV